LPHCPVVVGDGASRDPAHSEDVGHTKLVPAGDAVLRVDGTHAIWDIRVCFAEGASKVLLIVSLNIRVPWEVGLVVALNRVNNPWREGRRRLWLRTD